MIVPPLDVMRGLKFLENGKLYHLIDLKLKPGYYSDIANLNFTFNITAITER